MKSKILMLLASVLLLARAEIGEYSQRFSDQALDQRLCMSMVAGFEFFEQWLSEITDKYILFYSNPHRFRYKREKSERFSEVEHTRMNFQQFKLDLKLHRKKRHRGTVRQT